MRFGRGGRAGCKQVGRVLRMVLWVVLGGEAPGTRGRKGRQDSQRVLLGRQPNAVGWQREGSEGRGGWWAGGWSVPNARVSAGFGGSGCLQGSWRGICKAAGRRGKTR